ncbi:MAG: Glycosyl transferase group 1 [Parcubacteria group bacterium GW2011_GWF2_50_9]|nr:MAG: Glycosyl transferase group 1 [Parcubacteria group bacterium GW2011_GWF2_50_9]
MHEALERAVFLPRYDHYACVSDSTARQLRAALPNARRRITTIHNGFDASHWKRPIPKSALKTLRDALDLQGRYVVFGYGRPGTSKGFSYLLEAFPEIKRRIPNATLLLILSKDKQYASEIDRMRRRAKDLRIDGSVLIIDPKPYKELTIYAHMADCIVVPSITEGFGYTTLESCATGTPAPWRAATRRIASRPTIMATWS